MEKVAQDVALKALRSAAATSDPPLDPQTLTEAFQAGWPVRDRQRPMNDAITAAQAASACANQDPAAWTTAIAQAWQPAVEEVVQEYLQAARHCFKQGDPLQGVETLTDAVRATLGHIAATRNWPHNAHDDLYGIAATLGSNRDWPANMDEFQRALDNCTREGEDLGAALCASMGRPDMLKFGTYAGDPDGPEEEGFLFATTTIELANRMAGLAAA
jgi:hypothetical protein